MLLLSRGHYSIGDSDDSDDDVDFDDHDHDDHNLMVWFLESLCFCCQGNTII